MSFLDTIRREWQMAADSIAADGSDLAEEMRFDFAGHEREASDKLKAQQELAKSHVENPKMASSFVHGWYAARNSCKAQGGHSGGPSHSVGPNFGNFENTGHSGPEFGA